MIKIGKKIKGDDFQSDTLILMLCSSVLYFVPVLVMGQYDIFCSCFVLLGVDAYISDKQKQFIGWFAIALSFKLFALFVFIPLLLLKEKKIFKLLLNMILGCSVLLFWKVMQIVFFTVSETATSYVGGHFLAFIFQSQWSLVYSSSSAFIIGFLLVCMYCYFKLSLNKEEVGLWAIYVSFLGLAVFFVSSLTHPQWNILLLPFAILLVLCRDERDSKVGMWISTIFCSGLLLSEIIFYSWVFRVYTSLYMIAGKLFYSGKNDIGYSIKDLLTNIVPENDMNYINMIGGGIFVAGIIFFLYWAHPKTNQKKFVNLECSLDSILIVRELILLMIAVILIALLF